MMKQGLIFLLVMCCSLSVFAQPDTEKKNSIKIPAIPTENNDTTASKSLDIKPIMPKPKFNASKGKSKFNVEIREIKPQKKEFSMFGDNDLRNPGELFEKRYIKKLEDEGIKPAVIEDINLGEIILKGGIPNIRTRDHGAFDGDYIQVVVNGEVYISQMLLTPNFKVFDVPLNEGRNVVEFIALNEGSLLTNTAEFQVHDDDGNLVSYSSWRLSKGSKAVFVINKDSKLPVLDSELESSNENDKEN